MAAVADLLLEEGAVLALGLAEGPPVPAPMEVLVARAAGRRALAAPAGAAALRSVRRPLEIVRPAALPTDSSRRRGVLVLVLVEAVVEATEEGADRASEVVEVEEVEHRLFPLVAHLLVVLVLLGVDRPSEAPSRPFVTLSLCTACWNLGWTRAGVLLAVVVKEEGINNRRPSP